MDFRPILSTLRRHRTAAALIVLEIALTCAIVCNAVYLIGDRLQRLSRDSGVAEPELLHIELTGIGTDANPWALSQADLAALRAVPGVRHAALANQLPYGGSAWNGSLSLRSGQEIPNLNTALYMGSEDLLETLGLRLVAGRDFRPDEYVDFDALRAAGSAMAVPAVILNRAVAERLFPGQDPVGRSLYVWNERPTTVVGVVEALARPNLTGGPGNADYSVILSIRTPYTVAGDYLLRVDPARRAEVLQAAAAALRGNGPDRILLEERSFDEVRAEYFSQDRAMAWLLAAVCIALLVVTALGIVGLASFWVQQRTRMIGIRRALGATRGQILGYFQAENFLLATMGIALGMLGAYAINQVLMNHYELPRLPAAYLPVGAALLWALGQLAVLGPARRAAAVPPAVATRSAW